MMMASMVLIIMALAGYCLFLKDGRKRDQAEYLKALMRISVERDEACRERDMLRARLNRQVVARDLQMETATEAMEEMKRRARIQKAINARLVQMKREAKLG